MEKAELKDWTAAIKVIVKDDGSLERLPFGRYNRLLQRHPSERLFQYAGKRVRCVVIVVESINRKPVEILKCQYSYLSFDSDGMIKKGGEGEVKLAMDMLEPVIIVGGVQCFSILHCRTSLLRHAVSKYLETGCEYQNWVQKLNG